MQDNHNTGKKNQPEDVILPASLCDSTTVAALMECTEFYTSYISSDINKEDPDAHRFTLEKRNRIEQLLFYIKPKTT